MWYVDYYKNTGIIKVYGYSSKGGKILGHIKGFQKTGFVYETISGTKSKKFKYLSEATNYAESVELDKIERIIVGQSAVNEETIQKIRKDNEDFFVRFSKCQIIALRHIKVFSWLPIRSSDGRFFIGPMWMLLSNNKEDTYRSFTYFRSWAEVERSWLGA